MTETCIHTPKKRPQDIAQQLHSTSTSTSIAQHSSAQLSSVQFSGQVTMELFPRRDEAMHYLPNLSPLLRRHFLVRCLGSRAHRLDLAPVNGNSTRLARADGAHRQRRRREGRGHPRAAPERERVCLQKREGKKKEKAEPRHSSARAFARKANFPVEPRDPPYTQFVWHGGWRLEAGAGAWAMMIQTECAVP